VCYELINRFDGKVPSTEQELLSIKGIGQKTANAVLGYAFNIPALCVDTHVHQIANRLGWVKTKTPDQTEEELKKIVPVKNWIELNRLLVLWGQNICTPVRPFCSRCAIAHLCPKIGVKNLR
jgi:endonuclease-3